MSTFVGNEKIKYKFIQDMKFRWNNLVAPIKNHPKKDDIKKLIINLTFTWLVMSTIVFCFDNRLSLFPLRVGFGIAVTIAIAQYYIRWYKAL